MIKVIKKDGTLEDFTENKIINAINKSAERVCYSFSKEEINQICKLVNESIPKNKDNTIVDIKHLHNIVEISLDKINSEVAKSYRDYRNYKQDFVHMLDEVYKKSQSIRYIGDRDNANTDSALIPTQRSLIYNELNSELYKHFFLNPEERSAMKDGYIYIHDRSARLDTMNCCIFDMENVLNGGFEMGNVKYTEPKTLDVAFDVISDITMSAAASQYGGFTIPEVDKLLNKYAEKSYIKYKEEFNNVVSNIENTEGVIIDCLSDVSFESNADEYAYNKVKRDFEQGFQSWEMAFNTVGSSRGDYPFIAVSFGIGQSRWEQLATETILKVRQGGQGEEGFKKPVLFPKLTFLYDENLHGKGKTLEHLFDIAIDCSSKCMYPDFLSLTGEGYIPSIYKKYNKVVSLMGCVDGQELITYKIKDELFVESFERMWTRLSSMFEIKKQSPNSPHLYIEVVDTCIYDTKQGFVKIKKVIRNLSEDWVDITIQGGRNLRCTVDHPLPTQRGRVLAKDLTENDLITINHSQYSENKFKFNEDVAWLLGLILCDGCYDNGQITVSLATEGEDDVIKKYQNIMVECFNINTKIVERRRGTKGNYKDVVTVENCDFLIDYLFSRFEGMQKNNRHIPNIIFRSTLDSKLAFLAGMIDADGYINSSKNNYSRVQIESVNKELSLQQLALSQSCGIAAFMYHNHYSKSHPEKIRYRIEFKPNDNLLPYIACEKKKKHFVKTNFDTTNYLTQNKISKLSYFTNSDYSYDVETESDHFEVSGIYSHNCRASLSPYYKNGGMKPLDKFDEPIFVGRCNLGAVSLNLPMILQKSRVENKDFYEVLGYYLELIRNLHKKTFNYLSEKKASTNPLAYCEGGFYGGNLKPDEKIGKILKPMTLSFGITALNELQQLYNQHSLVEDNSFALEVMKYINKRLNEFKEEDGLLYAVYGTPAETLAGLQSKQFRAKYGVIKNVSDRPYVSNSFHCGVWEHISPITKQNKERAFWDLFNGGKIQYCKYPVSYNKEAMKTLVRRAMEYGFYEGINLDLSYCEDCGYEQLDMDKCPKCGSEMITKINRMNGYLGYTRVHGKTRYNDSKNAEIKDRVSM